MNEREIFDQIIEESIKEDIDNIEVPKGDDVWNNISTHIKEKNKSSRIQSNKKIVGILAVLVLSGFILLHPNNEGYAKIPRILGVFSKLAGEKLNIYVNYNDSDSKSLKSQQDVDSEIRRYKLTLEEAKIETDFSIKTPGYIPNEYEIKEVTLTKYKDRVINLVIKYTDNNNWFSLQQEKIRNNSSEGIEVNSKNSEYKKVNRNGVQYNIIESSQGRVLIIWDMFEVKYTLIGSNKDELLKIAYSIK
ncbi:DUF4367 domain-containing protein [Caloranaerobacter sp. DY30410]|uniref:DUF4367 domain-containing protein n=1 Tax=Caloranaerobacter sp. DY30410 TaxID=3238305 RepID=UPI003D019E35